MRYRRFGTTDLTVSELGFGCARLGGIFNSTSSAAILYTLRSALDQGITIFDTADLYCQGESEELVGKAFRNCRRQVVIASKAGYCLPTRRKAAARLKPLLRPALRALGLKRRHLPGGLSGALGQDFSPGYLVRAVEQSLQRLRTDYLDLFQLHSPPSTVLEQGDFLTALERLQAQGKIRYYGVSCATVEDALVCLRYSGISSVQVGLSLLHQRPLADLVPAAHHHGVAIIARECFAGGELAKSADAGTAIGVRPAETAAVTAFRRIAEQHGRPLAQLALQFVRNVDGVTVTLLGMRTEAQLSANIGHLQAPPLTAAELCELREQAVLT